jgi:hypothetical protein
MRLLLYTRENTLWRVTKKTGEIWKCAHIAQSDGGQIGDCKFQACGVLLEKSAFISTLTLLLSQRLDFTILLSVCILTAGS